MIERIGIFKQFGMAFGGLVKPSMYSRLRKQGFGKILLFVLTISLINAAITWLIPGINLANDDSFKEFFKDLPAFEISNNTIYVEKQVFTQSDDAALYIDTSVKSFSNKDITSLVNQYSISANQIIMISETNIISYDYGKATELSVKDLCSILEIDYLDNNNIGDYFAKFLFYIFLIIMVFAFLYFTIAYFVTGLLFAIIGKIAGALTDTSYTFGEHYAMGIYIAAFWKILSRIMLVLITSLTNGPVFFMAILFITVYIYIAQVKKEDTYNQDAYVPSYNNFNSTESVNNYNPNPSSYVVPTDDIVFEAPPTKQESSDNPYSYDKYSYNSDSQNTTSTSSTSGFKLKD